MTLGERIANFRKEKNMTQEALAGLLGVTNQAVSKWETDQCYPDVAQLPKLADIFEISLDQLFGRETPNQAPRIEGLPWEDDGVLRAVVYIGRTLRKHQAFHISWGKMREWQQIEKIEFQYDGPALDVVSDLSVSCHDVGGNVKAGDRACCGNVGGSVSAGDGVTCGNVEGSVTAGDGVRCGNVGGNVRAGDSVTCGDIGGSATAGDSVRCGNVKGSIKSRG